MEKPTERSERANLSGPGFMPRPPLTVQAVTLTLVPLVCAVGVAGNAMVVLVVVRSLHTVTSTNCYLVSLATADLLVLLAAGVPTVTEAASARVWIFGHAGCLGIITYLQYVGINASTGSITAFTVERYLAICRPLSAQALCPAARAKRIAALVWLGTGACCVLWLFLVDTREAAYADGVQGHARALRGAAASWRPPAGQGRLSSRGRRGALSSRKQVTKMLAVVGVLFALLWLPYHALVVVNSFLSPPYLNLGFLLFCRLCIYVNSAVNPIVYALMSQRFREAFHGLFQYHLARPKALPREASLVYYGVIRDCSQHRLGSWKKPGGVMSRQEGDPATSR
ncbi:unnamed protein product [Rangifer tarandus platyrhynchus]|uniref:Thyrotropin-releasing hormone receptor n=1 Tax=Rangifer tarandus platyrhynchus TaxID=3082113 RepID=A0ABN8XZK1_RANTA|nr:unnamed protein product [Rangifer tarandus platyrhynchus]